MNQLLWTASLIVFGLIASPTSLVDFIVAPEMDAEGAFGDFVNKFEQADFPLVIDVERLKDDTAVNLDRDAYVALEKKSRRRNLSWELREFVPGRSPRYGRVPPDEYEPYALLAKNDDYIAVVLAGKQAFALSPSYYKLVTYTPDGKIIAVSTIAERSGLDEYVTASIDADLTISMDTYRLGKNGEKALRGNKSCAILSTGLLFPEANDDGFPVRPPNFKKQKLDLTKAKASLF